jgi:DNA polymerase/3'-5' exonuclease PolX
MSKSWSDLIKIYQIKIDKSKNKTAIQSYTKLINQMRQKSGNPTVEDIQDLQITDYMKGQVCSLLQCEEKKGDVDNLTKLMSIMGIGKKKAEELIDAGVTSTEQLTQKRFFKLLPQSTQVFLKTEPEAVIEYAEIKELVPILQSLVGKYKIILVGAFRREAKYTKDIDVMLVSDNEEDLYSFVNKMKEYTETHIYNIGPLKCSMVVLINKYYRIDVFRCPVAEEPTMLLHSTGSKDFNIMIRSIAKKKGYKLNDKGLYKRETNQLIPIHSEADVFKVLELEFVEPRDRTKDWVPKHL